MALKGLRRANKGLARKRRFSANWRKAKRRLSRIHAHIANARRDNTHKLTTLLAKTIFDLQSFWRAISQD